MSLLSTTGFAAPRVLAPSTIGAPIARFQGSGSCPAFSFFIRYTPLFWALGGLTFYAGGLVIALAYRRWPKGRLANVVVASWVAVTLAQALCSILNGIEQNDVGLGLRNALATPSTGWTFGALAIAVGAAWRLAGREWAKEAARLGIYILGLAVLAFGMKYAGVKAPVVFYTPVYHLLPGGKAALFYTTAQLYEIEQTLGSSMTRLVLFFPWAPALGLGALSFLLISVRTLNPGWRFWGIAGSAVGVVFSWSRIAIAAMLLTSVFVALIRLPPRGRIALVAAGVVAVCIASVMGHDPVTMFSNLREAADSARQGSSMARDLIYFKSWEGFLQSPIIGNGWIGDSVHRSEELPIGSHSSVYGLLYTGGIVTFVTFVIAMSTTLGALLLRLHRVWSDQERREDTIIGLLLWLTLALFSPYESLFSITLPCLMMFTWIGGVLAEADPTPELSGSTDIQREAPLLLGRSVRPRPRLQPVAATTTRASIFGQKEFSNGLPDRRAEPLLRAHSQPQHSRSSL